MVVGRLCRRRKSAEEIGDRHRLAQYRNGNWICRLSYLGCDKEYILPRSLNSWAGVCWVNEVVRTIDCRLYCPKGVPEKNKPVLVFNLCHAWYSEYTKKAEAYLRSHDKAEEADKILYRLRRYLSERE